MTGAILRAVLLAPLCVQAALSQSVRLSVYNRAAAPWGDLRYATEMAAAKLRCAGLDVKARVCKPSNDCPRHVDSALLLLEVVPSCSADATLPPNTIAFARPTYASICLDIVHRLADTGLASVRDILAAAILHESVHLLDRSAPHAEDGVMKRVWENADLSDLTRYFRITDAEKERLRTAARLRIAGANSITK